MEQSNEFCSIETWRWAEEGPEGGIKIERKVCEKSQTLSSSIPRSMPSVFQTGGNGCSCNKKGSVTIRLWEYS